MLVADAGSASLHLRILGKSDEVLAEADARPQDAGPQITELTARAGGEVQAAGHRLVLGGPGFTVPVVVDDAIRERLEQAAGLAPLHLPPALAVLDAARAALPGIPHVACFDSAFHEELPEAARTYAVPARWREHFGARRYGFHGLSYAWALARAGAMLGRNPSGLQVVLAHLGGGCSAVAVRNGRSADTTMGLTPLEGLVMGRRSGSIDPGLLLWLQTEHGLTATEISEALYHDSGLAGLSGTSDDTRDLVRARAAGDQAAALALAVFARSAIRGIAAMASSLDRLDALVFTGEIGEDQPEVREEICAGLGILGISSKLDPGHRSGDAIVSGRGARVPVLVVGPGEIAQIAAEVRAALSPAR